jgi:diguanylate cyclase (GGDEF)-like protein
VSRRGGREIVMLPLAARGADIGVVTLMRSDAQPFEKGEVGLLRILADQLAIAIQNARDYREKLEQAVRDPLTGLYNRRFFFEALEKEVKRAERYGSHASLVIFDIDDFKQINDTLGHAAGDEALRAIAKIVSDLIRDVDSFARIGGEEFALLLPQAQQLDGLLVAERVRTAISRQKILPDRRVTVSGGVSSCPLDAITREALEQKADAALYWAKRNGKNICALSSEATERSEDVETEDVVAHLTALVSAIDASHLHTRDHSENVAAYAVAIGQEMGLDADRIMRLRRAGLLHDVGKVAVPTSVLEKPAALDAAEFEQIKLHSGVGATMLLHAGLVEEAAWVRSHHERLDGGGYPDGLAGDAIPLEARILFVADAFEAMTSDRPYREGTDIPAALAELRRCAGTQFDPTTVAALATLVERGELAVLAFRAGEIEV